MPVRLNRLLMPVVLVAGIAAAALPGNFAATGARAQEHLERGYPAHLGDLMNESMQVHHIKLGLAGRANNWPLAAYEVRKLEETIEEVKEAIVEIQRSSTKWQRVPVGEMLGSLDAHLDAIEDAVKHKDAAKFAASYRALTASCNACHERASEPQIKIIEPPAGSGAFIDQDFSGAAPR